MADKLEGNPYSDVNSWLYEIEKELKKDPGLPMRASNRKTQKESKMPANKMANLFQDLVNTVNDVIDDIDEIKNILIPQLRDDIDQIVGAVLSHRYQSSAHHVKTPPSQGRKGGTAKQITKQREGANTPRKKQSRPVIAKRGRTRFASGGKVDKLGVQPYDPLQSPLLLKPPTRPDPPDPPDPDYPLEPVVEEGPLTFSRHNSACVQLIDDYGGVIPGTTFWGMKVEWEADLMSEIWVGDDDSCWNGQPCCNYVPQTQCKCRCIDNLPSNSAADALLGGYMYAHTVPYCNRYDNFWYAQCNFTTTEDCCWWYSIGPCDHTLTNDATEDSGRVDNHTHSGNCESMCDTYCNRLDARKVNDYPDGFVPFGPPAPWTTPSAISGPNNRIDAGCYVRECTGDSGCQDFSQCYGEDQMIDNYNTPDGMCWDCGNSGNTWCTRS